MPEAASEPEAGKGDAHILTHEFPPFRGGIGVYVEEMAIAMAGAGFRTAVWAPDYGSGVSDSGSYTVRRVPMRGKQDWLCRAQLAKALRQSFTGGRIPGTVILAEPGPVRLWMYHRLLRLPRPDRLVVILHGTEIRTLASLAHRKLLLGNLLRDADRVGVVSRAVGDMVRSHYPFTSGKLALVPGAVRERWRELPPASGHGKQLPWQIVQVGRISPRKGQQVLVEAFRQLPGDLKHAASLTLAGPTGKPSYRRRVEEAARAHKVPLRFAGSVKEDQLRELYEEAAIVVMPSQPYRNSIEGLGIALLEGAHFGCPLIGSRIGGIPETMIEGKTGLLVDPGDAASLAAALEQLLRNPERAAQMGAAGAAFVRKHFSWQRNVSRLMGEG